MERYGAILDQSECVHLHNHQSNYMNNFKRKMITKFTPLHSLMLFRQKDIAMSWETLFLSSDKFLRVQVLKESLLRCSKTIESS